LQFQRRSRVHGRRAS